MQTTNWELALSRVWLRERNKKARGLKSDVDGGLLPGCAPIDPATILVLASSSGMAAHDPQVVPYFVCQMALESLTVQFQEEHERICRDLVASYEGKIKDLEERVGTIQTTPSPPSDPNKEKDAGDFRRRRADEMKSGGVYHVLILPRKVDTDKPKLRRINRASLQLETNRYTFDHVFSPDRFPQLIWIDL